MQSTILDAVATGEKSRNYIDEVCADELGATKDSVYKRGLIPLRGRRPNQATQGRPTGSWHWCEAEAA